MPMSPRLLRPRQTGFTPRSISGLALWLDAADSQTLYTTDAGPVTAVSAPTEISGLRTWWDFSDASTLFQNSDGTVAASSAGDRVGYVKDKVGSSNLTQATSNLRGTVVASGIGGRRCVSLPSDAASGWDFTGAALSSATWFIVAKYTGTANWITVHSGANYVIDAIADGSADSAFATSGTPSYRVNGVSQAGVRNTLHDAIGGANVPYLLTATSVSHFTWPTAANAWSLGRYTSTFNFIGEFGEILWFDGTLSPADRARVEAYLAAKWGIAGVHAPATATNDPVGAWLDKSGNGRHATQATGSDRPAVSATAQNGRRAIAFDGSTDWMRTERTNYLARTVVTVFRRTATAPNSFMAVFAKQTGVAVGYGGSSYVSNTEGGWSTVSNGSGRMYYNSSAVPHRLSAAYMRGALMPLADAQSPSGGIAAATTTTQPELLYAEAATDSGNQAWFIGTEPFATTRKYPADVLELMIYSSVLSTAERQRIERYLAAKWGITLAPQVSNADAQDWINRVYANGGTVSAATASAVNTFCDSITNAGIRDRFYRLNLFCGNSDASLNAVRTPLYRGPSLGGTQYGNATDTNVNFVQGDYAEGVGLSTVSSGTKHLDTGLATSALPAGVISTGHLAAWHGPLTSQGDYDPILIGALNSTTDRATIHTTIRITANAGDSGRWGRNTIVTAADGTIGFSKPSAFLLTQRTSETNLELWRNGAVVATNTASTTGIAGIPHSFTVFRLNNTGTVGGELNPGGPLRGYSVGDDMTSGQVLAFRAAWSAFNTAMGRTT